jgi:diadenosine tetraphosphate (Ap4A) HIT family hydrolase
MEPVAYFPGCVACEANAGQRTAPGGVIHQDVYWRLEHALSPAPLAGWLILKPLRHCEGLEELTEAEAAALGPLLRRACAALRAATGAAKVYSAFWGEAVAHLHIHLIPRAPDLAEELRGPAIFELLRRAVHEGVGVPDADAAAIADAVRELLNSHGRGSPVDFETEVVSARAKGPVMLP